MSAKSQPTAYDMPQWVRDWACNLEKRCVAHVRQAYETGRAQGQAAGYARGFKDGYETGARR